MTPDAIQAPALVHAADYPSCAAGSPAMWRLLAEHEPDPSTYLRYRRNERQAVAAQMAGRTGV